MIDKYELIIKQFLENFVNIPDVQGRDQGKSINQDLNVSLNHNDGFKRKLPRAVFRFSVVHLHF